MKTTFDNWINNPMITKNSVLTHRDMYKKMYTEKFDKILLREAGKINYTLYSDKKNNEYYIHIKIPSEVVEKFYYDVVIQFYSDKDAITKNSASLKDYNIRFFSNDPSFVFTYLRVFKKNDLFIDDLDSKCSKLSLTKDPKEKNPQEIITYIKSIYFTFLYMKLKNLFNKSLFDMNSVPYNKKALLSKIVHADQCIADRQRLGKEVSKKNKTNSTIERAPQTNSTVTTKKSNTNSNVKKTKITKPVKNIMNTVKKR